ncbi:MAG TPA: retropepsin-like aspartic protease [Chthoniobacterales bacterium]
MKKPLHTRRALCCLTIAACLGAIAFAHPGMAARQILSLAVLQRDGYGVVPILKARVNELFIKTEIDGHRALIDLDTGDGIPGLILDKNMARICGINGVPVKGTVYAISGKISDLRKGVAKTVAMGNLQIQNFTIYTGGFVAPQNSTELGSSRDATVLGGEDRFNVQTDGFVGAEFLRHAGAILDLENLLLYLRPSGGRHKVDLTAALAAHGLASANLVSTNDATCMADVEVNGTPAKMLVDTGAYYTEIDSRFADQIHLHQHRSEFYRVDGAGVRTLVNKAFPDTLKVGGVNAYPPEATIDVDNMYTQSHGKIVGLLGLDFLGQSWAIMDFGNSKLYFAPKH